MQSYTAGNSASVMARLVVYVAIEGINVNNREETKDKDKDKDKDSGSGNGKGKSPKPKNTKNTKTKGYTPPDTYVRDKDIPPLFVHSVPVIISRREPTGEVPSPPASSAASPNTPHTQTQELRRTSTSSSSVLSYEDAMEFSFSANHTPQSYHSASNGNNNNNNNNSNSNASNMNGIPNANSALLENQHHRAHVHPFDSETEYDNNNDNNRGGRWKSWSPPPSLHSPSQNDRLRRVEMEDSKFIRYLCCCPAGSIVLRASVAQPHYNVTDRPVVEISLSNRSSYGVVQVMVELVKVCEWRAKSHNYSSEMVLCHNTMHASHSNSSSLDGSGNNAGADADGMMGWSGFGEAHREYLRDKEVRA